jgi:hypothetical protein
LQDLTVVLQNKPGGVALVGETLGNAGINIEGGFGLAIGDRGELHVCVADADAARSTLSVAGIECGRARDVEVVSLKNEPGELGRHLRQVADAGVNIELMYVGTDTRLVLASDDMVNLRSALRKS